MGQQQLLLIVLGVIIVGIAVVVGINVFTASSVNANRDAVIADLTTLASMAQQYYRKPIAMGGGGQSFDASTGSGGAAWTIPVQLTSTANGNYSLTSGTQSITLVGKGTEVVSGTDTVEVTMVVGPSAITSTTINH